MKKIATVLVMLVLLAGPAMAQLDPDDDGIGIYFDPCACVNCVPMEPGLHTAYVVITHPTSQQAGVGGWEAKIWLEGPGSILGIQLQGSAVNVGTAPEYIVGLMGALYNPFMYPAVIVASMPFQVNSTSTPIDWYIDGIYRHSLPERVPAYLDGDDDARIIALQQPTGGPDIPVATLNGGCAVDSEPSTWGGFKSLYR